MQSPTQPIADQVFGMTYLEVAEVLSVEEGRQVTVAEIVRLECQALRKLRSACLRRGLTAATCLPDPVGAKSKTYLWGW